MSDIIKTFQKPYNLTISNEPSCVNECRVEMYKVTVERIVEDDSVYIDRLQKLYDNTTNYHHKALIKNKAFQLKVEINTKRV